MEYKTFATLKSDVFTELNLDNEVIIGDDEFMAIVNRAIDYCEGLIHKFRCEDSYFEACAPLALTANYQDYALPSDIYANKIKKIICQKTDWIYEIKRMKKLGRYIGAAYADLNLSSNHRYEYMIINNSPTVGPRLRIFPKPQETTTVVSTTGTWTLGSQTITVASGTGIVAGQFVSGTGIPANSRVVSVSGVTVIIDSPTTAAGSATALTFKEDDFLIYYIRNANKITSTSDKIDIPEFSSFIEQFAKVECLKKEQNPRLAQEQELLGVLEKHMTETLAEMTPDEDNEVEVDNRFDEEIV